MNLNCHFFMTSCMNKAKWINLELAKEGKSGKRERSDTKARLNDLEYSC